MIQDAYPPLFPHHDQAWALVADEHALIRGGLKFILSETLRGLSFIEVVDGPELVAAARGPSSLALAVIDMNLPRLQGGAALLEFARLRPTLPLIVVAGANALDTARRAMTLPTVHAVVSKNADLHEMRLAIGAAMRGKRVAAPMPSAEPRKLAGLTPRQAEVHRLLRQGLSNRSIGALLGISEGTVKNHVYEIFRVLKATNRTQAAQLFQD